MTGSKDCYENIFTQYFTTMIIIAGMTQIIAGRCKRVKSVGKCGENNINDLEMSQSQNCKSLFLDIFTLENTYQCPNSTTKEWFRT